MFVICLLNNKANIKTRENSFNLNIIKVLNLLFGLNKMSQYPREAWRPVLLGNYPAFEQGLVHPARVWDLVEGLHLHLHHRIVSKNKKSSRRKKRKYFIFEFSADKKSKNNF